MHGSDALQRQIVVHHGEHTLLHLAAVPGIDDYLLTAGDVEDNRCLGVQSQFFVVGNFCLGSVVNNEIRLEVFQLLSGGLNEHVGYEVCLPCHFHDETDGHAGVFVGAAESVHHIQFLVGKLFLSDFLDHIPGFLAGRMVVVFVFIRSPPYSVLGILIHNDEFVFGRTSGVFAGHNVHCAQFADLTFLITFQLRFGLLLEQQVIGRVVYDLSGTRDAILAQIDFCHPTLNLFSIKYMVNI